MTHIAIFRQPFFDMIISGEKIIESRWSNRKIAPYKKVQKGDLILLKESGKDVTALAVAKKILFFELTLEKAEEIKNFYGEKIGIRKFSNWNQIKHKKYCTLIWLKDVKKIQSQKVKRSNGAGWIVIK